MTNNANSTASNPVDRLQKTVIDGGYCIGCGICAAVTNSPFSVELDKWGCFQAIRQSSENEGAQSRADVLSVCPFSEKAVDEDVLGREQFGSECAWHNRIGYHRLTGAGHVSEQEFRENGSSGGMGSWLLWELFRRGEIDAAVLVHPRGRTPDDPALFRFRVARSPEEIRAGAKSRYYPVEISGVLAEMRATPGRYAVVGLPCFIKGVRLLARSEPVFRERIRYCIGIICGHLKSTRSAEMFAWQCGIAPDDLIAIDFRRKLYDRPANQYGMEIEGIQEGKKVRVVRPRDRFFGYRWGLGLFKYPACNYCDDVLAETADATVGDAWLPQYVDDPAGNNVFVIRHPVLREWVEGAAAEGRLKIDPLEADDVARSQEAGLRQRREHLAYRLARTDARGLWRPPKRVDPSESHLSDWYRGICDLRLEIEPESHRAFAAALEAGDMEVFIRRLAPMTERYAAHYRHRASGKI